MNPTSAAGIQVAAVLHLEHGLSVKEADALVRAVEDDLDVERLREATRSLGPVEWWSDAGANQVADDIATIYRALGDRKGEDDGA